MTAMMPPSALRKYLNPHGLECIAVIVPPPKADEFDVLNVPVDRIVKEETWYQLTFRGYSHGRKRRQISCTVTISLPDSEKGVFYWGDRQRIAVWRCYQDLTAEPGEIVWRFLAGSWVILHELQKAAASGLRDFYFTGNPPSSAAFAARVSRIFSNSKICPVLPAGSVGRKSLGELVYMELPETLDLSKLQFPEQMFGILDPCSTSHGAKINQVYRMCQGTMVDKTGKASPANVDYCSTLADNAIGLDLVPHRANTLRTAFEASLDLINPEVPWAAGEMHDLSGVHLLTALMEHRWNTWEDCIAISQSAARKLQARRVIHEVVETFSPLELRVKEGDSVMPGGELLGVGLSREGVREPYVAHKVKHPSWVEKITASRTYVMGRPAVRYRFHLVSHIDAKTGDKFTTRAGTKGVIKIIPDQHMPTVDGVRVECCLSPAGVVGRKAMLVMWEMMMNRKQAMLGKPRVYEHLQQLTDLRPSFGELVAEGHGSKQQLWLKGKPLEHETFVGPVYLLRLDKVAHEIAAVQRGKRPVNHHKIPVDSAQLCGQRRDLAKALALSSRGLNATLAHLILDDTAGIGHVRKIVSILEPRYLQGAATP